jgi:predicted TIM-barrel fold metal-dependent hydrolase
MRSPWHPREWIRFLAYLSAAGVDDLGRADEDFVTRLQALADASPRPARHLLLAFDHHYTEQGEVDLEASHFYVPNAWVIEVAARRPDRFEAAISVHPYRKDALDVLRRGHAAGARFVKWLPNAMGIDPDSARCDAYYETMRELGMVLLTHTGLEEAVELQADQELGNPLRLRRALRAGVRVIAAHCASSGESDDLDHPGERRSSFELFLRLMGEEAWEALLWGEISTLTQYNRYPTVLAEVLRRTDLHPRLVNGSDWPLPAINVLYRVGDLVRDGFLEASEAGVLRELYEYNPLVFDLALKRRVRAPRTGEAFAAEVFTRRDSMLE